MADAHDPDRFKKAVDAAYDHIVLTDPKGVIIYANPAVTRTTGYSSEEVIGQTPKLWGRQMPPHFYEHFWHKISVLKKPFVGEIKNRRKNGEDYFADIRVTPVLDDQGEVEYFVGIERDITKLKELDQVKNDFVSLASHQLRTPLSTLSWYSETLLEQELGKLNTEQLRYVREMNQASRRMIALVNDLLNVSRIEMGKVSLQMTDVDITALVNDAIVDCKKLVANKKLTLIRDQKAKKCIVTTDRQAVSIVIENIITNAIKYTPEHGKITITTKCGQGHAIISVKDSGYGIPKRDQSHVFSKFYRASNVREHVSDGTGLGLYIAKSFIDRLGGSIRFETSEGKGTEFIVTLPINLSKKKADDNEKTN